MFLVSGIKYLFSCFIPSSKARAETPAYAKLIKIAPQISEREYARIQATITPKKKLADTRFVRKSRKEGFSVTITPQGVAYIHLGKRGKLLGTGSYKKVYEAVRIEGGHVSKIAEARIKQPSEIENALKEDKIAAKFVSPHNIESSEAVVQYVGRKGFFRFNKGLKKARFMQTLMAKDGKQFLRENPSFEQRLEVVEGALRGLKTIHEAGYVHRDVKPQNILIDDKGVSRLADLGLVIHQEDLATAQPAGTKRYLPGEINSNGSWCLAEEQTALTDLYSLGETMEYIMGKTATKHEDITRLQTRLKALNPIKRPTLDEAIAIIEKEHRKINEPPVKNGPMSICEPLINFPTVLKNTVLKKIFN